MKISTLKKIEKVCLLLVGILAIIISVSIVTLFTTNRKDDSNQNNTNGTKITESNKTGISSDNENELTQKMNHYPTNCVIGERLPSFSLEKEDGTKIQIDDYKGKVVVLSFWASWCPYCQKQLDHVKEFEETLKKYDNVEFILVNKLDGVKETKEQALEYLQDKGINLTNLYDKDLEAYEKLGMKIIPTTLILDENGILKVCRPGDLSGASELEALLDYTIDGGSYATEKFVTEQLTGEDGGVHVNYLDTNDETPSGYDVLSESQGILLEYAVITKNQLLFDENFSYIKEYLWEKPLVAWVYSRTEGASKVNALLDDLRIYKALTRAEELWGGYEEYLVKFEESIYEYNTKKQYLVDSYDFKYKKRAKRLTLCYSDFESLGYLVKKSKVYENIYNNTLRIVSEGYISDEFPLYYSWYNYKTNEYEKDNLNTAEAMYTLYHLAQIGELKEETIGWLKEMTQNGIKARYTVEGQVVEGYDYESTAIYALIGLIANEIEDNQLLTEAMYKMEQMRVNQAGDVLNGSFGANNGTDIFSFDQCMPLLLYGVLEEENME